MLEWYYVYTITDTVHGQAHQLSILFNLRNHLEISGFLYKKEKINKYTSHFFNKVL
jgi:hypothetical protein